MIARTSPVSSAPFGSGCDPVLHRFTVAARNITLSLPDEVVRHAKILAAQREGRLPLVRLTRRRAPPPAAGQARSCFRTHESSGRCFSGTVGIRHRRIPHCALSGPEHATSNHPTTVEPSMVGRGFGVVRAHLSMISITRPTVDQPSACSTTCYLLAHHALGGLEGAVVAEVGGVGWHGHL